MHPTLSAEQIDAVLPQTQCGLCGFDGCMPYAQALAHKQATINLCPPGGIETLQNLAHLLNEDPTPYLKEMTEKAKPRLVAVIREDECIGCTKCIQACPVDAILGAAKSMHTIITQECTGCELCVTPCPVDCIDLHPLESAFEPIPKQQADHARIRYQNRQERLVKTQEREKQKQAEHNLSSTTLENKKALLQAALLRAKIKKSTL